MKPMAQILARSVEILGITALGLEGAAMSEKLPTAFAHAHPFLEAVLPVAQGRMASIQALSDAAVNMDEASFD